MTMTTEQYPATENRAQVFIFDDLKPEDNAMLQALYSRSPASVMTHLGKVSQGSGTFMEQYYVGYGHASIGDCGTTTLFIEQVSMLAAKAVQDHPLYSGQEASTRYLDFTQQALVDPYNHAASRAILEGWMALYLKTLPLLIEALKLRHPYDAASGQKERAWDSACKARAFDIARGLLPLGTTTLLSWSTNLRQARDKLRQLKVHPLTEISSLAQQMYGELLAKYPNSFKLDDMAPGIERHEPRDAYQRAHALADHFQSADEILAENDWDADDLKRLRDGKILVNGTCLDKAHLTRYATLLQERPAHVPLPRRMERYGAYTVSFLLDFGSFRDVQRHRNGVCQIPLVDGRFGMLPWYMENVQALLNEADYLDFATEVHRLWAAIGQLPDDAGLAVDVVKSQYLYPMGTACLCQATYSLPEMIYVAELRSQVTVHATLRPIAQQLGQCVLEDFPMCSMTIDRAPDGWQAKRGEQDIVAKAA